MKKLFLFFVLVCLVSLAAGMQAEPYTKEDFKARMDRAIAYNEQEAKLKIAYSPEEYPEEERQGILDNFARLRGLKDQSVAEYNLFFDAYYSADKTKVNEQEQKLKKIFDEMNPLMVTIVKFEEIYNNILFWKLQLGYLIDNGVVEEGNKIIDNSKPFVAVKDSGETESKITDCCVSDPESQCCKEKVNDCCLTDPESDCCKAKQPEGNLLVLVLLAVVVIAAAAVYFVFMKK